MTPFEKLMDSIEEKKAKLDAAHKILDTLPVKVKKSLVSSRRDGCGGWVSDTTIWLTLPFDKLTYQKVRHALWRQGWEVACNWTHEGEYCARLTHPDYEERIVLNLEPGTRGSTCELIEDGVEMVTTERIKYKLVCP